MKSNELNQYRTSPIPNVVDRPLCPNCHKPLSIYRVYADEDDNITRVLAGLPRLPKKVIKWNYKSYGHFCSLRCGTRFANYLVNIGILDHIDPIK